VWLVAGAIIISACGEGGDVATSLVPTSVTTIPTSSVTATVATTSQPTTTTAVECPTRQPSLPDQELPEVVAETRERIYLAAIACDWAALEELTVQADGIQYGDGAIGWVGNPVPFWRDSVDGSPTSRGKHDLWYVAGVLELPYGTMETQDAAGQDVVYYYWPGVAREGPTADWDILLGVYSPQQVEAFRQRGNYVDGLYVGIRADGTWAWALWLST
jgi:hypothetical protein